MTIICRLCLRSSTDMMPLFETLLDDKLLNEIILSTLGVELENDMYFPRQICQDCLKNVGLLYSFCQQLIKTQSLLSQWKSEGKAIVGSEEQIDTSNSQESSCVLEENEKKGSSCSSTIKTELIDTDCDYTEYSVYHDSIAASIQEQIEQDHVVIKHEPVDSDDDKTAPGNDKRKGPKKREKIKKGAKTIINKCYICGPTLESESDFYYHIDSHKNMVPYECSQCTTAMHPVILSSVILLNKHFETHRFEFTCRKCPLRFRTRCTRDYHVQTNHTKRKSEYNCLKCGKMFANGLVFRNHVRGHKNISTQRFKCNICGKVFMTQQGLKRHHPTHKR